MSRQSAHVRRILDVIEDRLGGDLSLRALARVVDRQEAYIGRVFHQQMGISLREYVVSQRMEHAATQIRKGEKVEAVALEVGYKSKKNFYKQFRQRFGVTPSAYRTAVLPPLATPPSKGPES